MGMRIGALVVVGVGGIVGWANPADACGGLFCSQTSPTPVDQKAERILFEVHDDSSVTSTVEIKYSGDPRAFSWIIPVPGTPQTVDVAPASALLLLDALTRPTLIGPQLTCSRADIDGSSPQSPTEGADPNVGVDVTTYPSVGPFDGIISVSGEDPQQLIDFLNDNGYLVTEAMRSYIEAYTLEGAKFLAVKLAPGAEVSDIVPIRFHCPAENPTIPIRLTAIAAEPDMSILAVVVARQRYEPSNWAEVPVPESELRVDANTGQNNYFPIISRAVDRAGGSAFVVERAASSAQTVANIDFAFLGTADEEQAKEDLRGILAEGTYLTRFYTRLHPEEMLDDPIFRPSTRGDVDGIFDASQNQPVVDVCSGETPPPPPPCGFTYCGLEGECAIDSTGAEGCACSSGFVARRVSDPSGRPTVSCQSQDMQVLGGVAGLSFCDGVDCGNGACRLVNGVATCMCDEGNVAVANDQNRAGVSCRALVERLPDNIAWPFDRRSTEAPGLFGCSAQPHSAGFLTLGLAALLLLHRRRRRH